MTYTAWEREATERVLMRYGLWCMAHDAPITDQHMTAHGTPCRYEEIGR